MSGIGLSLISIYLLSFIDNTLFIFGGETEKDSEDKNQSVEIDLTLLLGSEYI